MTRNEKRRSPRYKPKTGTHIVYIEGSSTVKDLSEDGMYILNPEPLPAGSKIKFALRLGTIDIELEGIISRSTPQQGMMIQFVDISREAKRRLRIHFAELGPSTEESKKS